MKIALSLPFLLLIVTACSDEMSVRTICERHPEICEDLNKDGWCRYERAGLIRERYSNLIVSNDERKYALISNLEKYIGCIGLASQIEHDKRKERSANRTEGYLAAMKELDKLVIDTRESEYPPLMFYQWSREGRTEPLNKLLEMDASGLLETADMQFKLASYYSKENPELTIRKLYHALSLLQPGEEADVESYTTLATLFFARQDYTHSYLWMRVAEMTGNEHADTDDAAKQFNLSDEMVEKLDERAATYQKMIKEASFNATPPGLE